jgi:hypothetical protein
MTMFIAHIQTADGEVINAAIMAPDEVNPEAIKSAVEDITQGEFPGSTLVGFHEAHERKPEPRREPLAIENMVLKGMAAVGLTLWLVEILHRKSQQ